MAVARRRKPGRPVNHEIRTQRQEEILDAAARFFAERGYSEANIQELADILQVGKGTVYRYFPTKEALFLATVDRMMQRLTAAIDEDVVAFNSVMGAYGLPRATDEEKAARTAAIQAALKEATLAPLRAVKACFEVIRLSADVAEKGNLNVISDAGVAVLAANAGLRSAALNVFINAKSIKDRDFAEKQLAEVNALLDESAKTTEAVYQTVRAKIGS